MPRLLMPKLASLVSGTFNAAKFKSIFSLWFYLLCPQEHKCVLDSCRALESEGFDVTYLPVMKNGLIDLQVLYVNLQRFLYPRNTKVVPVGATLDSLNFKPCHGGFENQGLSCEGHVLSLQF